MPFTSAPPSFACGDGQYALSRGIHVLMEKPAAISRDSFQKLVLAQSAYGAHWHLFSNRYNASSRRLKELITSGKPALFWARAAFDLVPRR